MRSSCLRYSRAHSWPFATLLIVVLTLFVLKTAPNILLQAGGLDAYFYTSYIQNYADLMARYGPTYYSSRIAHLLPSRVVTLFLGPEYGYLAYRILLLSIALGAVWNLAWKRYGGCVAALVTIVTACHPWLLRSLFWEHYDSSAVVYLLLTTSMVGSASVTDRWKMFLGGSAYALAANCNTFLLGIGLLLFVSYFVAHCGLHLKEWVAPSAIAFSGFLLTYVGLCVIYYVQFPLNGFAYDLLSSKFAIQMLAGLGKTWHMDVAQLVRSGWGHLFVPPLVLLATSMLVVARRQRTRPVVIHACLNLLLVSVAYILIDFVQKVAVISLFYYWIYLFPVTLFCLIVLIGEVAEEVEPASRAVLLGGFGAACLVARATYSGWISNVIAGNFYWLALLAVLAAAGLAILRRHSSVALVAVVMTALISPLPFYAMPAGTYAAIYTGNSALEWDVYRAAIQLQRLIARYPPRDGAVGFWYTNQTGSLLNSVQSMYLWLPSRLAPPGNPEAGMPAVPNGVLARAPLFRYLVLLAEQAGQIAEGKRALDQAGIQTRFREQTSYAGLSFRMECLVLERLDQGLPPAAPRWGR